MKKIGILFSIVLVVVGASCNETKTPEDCPVDIACTEQFEVFTYSPVENGQAVILDNYYVQNLDNSNTYWHDDALTGDMPGVYVVATDAQFPEVKKEGTVFRFTGIRNDRIVIEEDFLIGHDCCHILPLEGPGVN